MKPFLVLLLPFVLLGCGASEEDAIVAIEDLGGTVETDAKSGEVVEVNLERTQITDAGLVYLKGMTRLTELGLANTQITDAGLEHLKDLTSLTTLGLDGTKITDAGLAEIKAALPNCDIYRYR